MFQQDMLQVFRWALHSWMKALWYTLRVLYEPDYCLWDSWSFVSVMQYTTCHNNWCYPFPHLLIFSWNYVLCWALPTTIDVVLIHGLSSYYMWTLLKILGKAKATILSYFYIQLGYKAHIFLWYLNESIIVKYYILSVFWVQYFHLNNSIM